MSALGDKHFDRWVAGYLRDVGRRAWIRSVPPPRHLLFAVCDHHEPLWGGADEATGQARMDRWTSEYVPTLGQFRDADGRAPQHTWFFPGEQYRPRLFAGLDALVAAGLGEVEIHLHHDGDTEAGLRRSLEQYLTTFAAHGHLSRAADGRIRYAFIHGNWTLANGRPDGRRCGVDAELPLLFATGCYADFTFPSCPDVTQPRMVNAIYWPTGDLRRRRAYDGGVHARVGQTFRDRLLIVTGPLAVVRRPGRLVPRLEYGALTAHDPPSLARIRSWVAQQIHVRGRPEWVFVKVYTHGSPEPQAASLLGDGGRTLHRILAEQYNDGIAWRLHYVTAREMFNIARAAMDGHAGDPGAFRDYELTPPPLRARTSGVAAG
jgi:hypothetical protein